MRRWMTITATGLLLASTSHAAVFDQLIGAVTPAGDAYLVKRFSVQRGSVVAGVQFYSNDLRTTFPEVTLLQGPASRLSDATVLVQLTNVRPVGRHLALAPCAPLRIASDEDIYVAIRLPASDGIRRLGDGAGIAARRHNGPPTSYFATGREGAFGAMDVDYAIDLVVQTVGKASQESESRQGALPSTFLRARRLMAGVGTTDVDFGLEQFQDVFLALYDVTGRRVRTLVHGALGSGSHSRKWDGRDDLGRPVAAGVYLVRLEADHKVLTQKLVLLR